MEFTHTAEQVKCFAATLKSMKMELIASVCYRRRPGIPTARWKSSSLWGWARKSWFCCLEIGTRLGTELATIFDVEAVVYSRLATQTQMQGRW